jgi:hypothetical protein
MSKSKEVRADKTRVAPTKRDKIFGPHIAACGCQFHSYGDEEAITYCPTHGAALDLLAALRMAADHILHDYAGKDAKDAILEVARAAISKAEGAQ